MSRGFFLAAILIVACMLFAPAAQAGGGSILGTVTDASTTEPIEGVEVCAWSLSEEEAPICADTDGAGKYTIGELAADEYAVEFWARDLGYVTQFYDGKAHWWEADPLKIAIEPMNGVDAELVEAASIEGTVTAAGEPVSGVAACLWGGGEDTFLGCEETDSKGNYEIAGIDPGEYRVEFWPGETGLDLAVQYYDHRFQLEEADPVALGPGETASEVDAELEPGAEIGGHVTSLATGAPLKGIFVCSIGALSGELWSCTATNGAGAYSLENLSQGQYKVVFSIDFAEWYGEEFSEGEDDGFPTQFWNNQATLAAADSIFVSTGQSVGGIDARLGSPGVPPSAPALTPPAAKPPTVIPRKRRCRRGFRRKRVKGKVRCVKVRKHRHRHRHHAQRLFAR